MNSSSIAPTIRQITCALYLKRELTVICLTGERLVVIRPVTKAMVYKQLLCIYRESAPSRSTIFRWLKRFEGNQPALISYAHDTRIAVRAIHPLRVEEASSAILRKHRENQVRFIAELQAQYDHLARTLDSLGGQVVLDSSTGKFILQKI